MPQMIPDRPAEGQDARRQRKGWIAFGALLLRFAGYQPQIGDHGRIEHPLSLPLDTLPKSIQRGAVHLRGILGSDFHVLLGDGHILMP